jgi:hypothetical protein
MPKYAEKWATPPKKVGPMVVAAEVIRYQKLIHEELSQRKLP